MDKIEYVIYDSKYLSKIEDQAKWMFIEVANGIYFVVKQDYIIYEKYVPSIEVIKRLNSSKTAVIRDNIIFANFMVEKLLDKGGEL